MDKPRCHWVDESKPDYVKYHDEEWGVPVYDDKKMFEFLVLESAQAGLSWYTILKRRDGYRDAFAQFDVNAVAAFGEQEIAALMENTAIIRNKTKINAAINNAQRFLEIQQEFGSFCDYFWAYFEHTPLVNNVQAPEDNLATSDISDAISKDMKKRGFKFFGSTICYAHLQASGLVNDHHNDCFRKQEIIAAY